jgi:site-specific DNA-methyltransferase (adenine-specific)
MKRELRDESVDMILTSPPYDNLRNYKGYEFDFEAIAPELFRVLKQGGVMVWVVNDATIDGSETGTSFKQALFFKEIGFKLNDTMIYLKTNPMPAPNRYRYFSAFEYMFVFSKGYPVTFNPLLAPRSNMTGDKRRIRHLRYGRNKDGIYPDKYVVYTVQEQVKRTNVWEYSVGMNNTTTDKIAYSHPAIFPEALAEDHILSWSNEGDVIYDPFSGSGTTGKMARKHGRNFIGSEISKEYCEIAWKRICNVQGVLL